MPMRKCSGGFITFTITTQSVMHLALLLYYYNVIALSTLRTKFLKNKINKKVWSKMPDLVSHTLAGDVTVGMSYFLYDT